MRDFHLEFINLSLSRWNKTETPATKYRTEYATILEKFENHDLFFTDGSKSDFGTGFSVVKQPNSIAMPIESSLLAPHASVFTSKAGSKTKPQ